VDYSYKSMESEPYSALWPVTVLGEPVSREHGDYNVPDIYPTKFLMRQGNALTIYNGSNGPLDEL
jgi:hypothetical protein